MHIYIQNHETTGEQLPAWNHTQVTGHLFVSVPSQLLLATFSDKNHHYLNLWSWILVRFPLGMYKSGESRKLFGPFEKQLESGPVTTP